MKNNDINLNHFRHGSVGAISVPFNRNDTAKIKITFPINMPKLHTRKNIEPSLTRKFTFDNLFKVHSPLSISRMERKRNCQEININIHNLNINNYNIYDTNDSKDDDSRNKFPVINQKYFNSFNKERDVLTPKTNDRLTFQKFINNNKKMRKVKVIDIKKIKLHQPKTIDNKIKEDQLKDIKEDTIPSKQKMELCDDNNDSFIDELADLLNVKVNTRNIGNKIEDTKSEEIPVINHELKRPETSYGGLCDRRRNLQSALQSAKNRTIKK